MGCKVVVGKEGMNEDRETINQFLLLVKVILCTCSIGTNV